MAAKPSTIKTPAARDPETSAEFLIALGDKDQAQRAQPQPDPTVRLAVVLPKATHQAFKMAAARGDTTMQEVMVRLIDGYIRGER